MRLETASDLGAILVTGATGQVGRTLVSALLRERQRVTILTRSPEVVDGLWPKGSVAVRAGDLTARDSLAGICEGIATVFHLASYAPRPDEPDIYNAPNHWPVTAEGSANLAAAVAASEVRRLVYVSTIKAMGDRAGALGHPAAEDIVPAPDTLYGRAKLAAEQSLLELGRARDIQVSVMRLPMVYGLNDKGNIARMVAAVASGRFPPWPHIENHRSAIHVADAVAAAILIARHPASGGQTYVATDGEGYATRWIYERILTGAGPPHPELDGAVVAIARRGRWRHLRRAPAGPTHAADPGRTLQTDRGCLVFLHAARTDPGIHSQA